MPEALGLPINGKLRPGDLVQSVVVVAEVYGEDNMALGVFTSEPLTEWQKLGMLRAAVVECENELRHTWIDEDDEDDLDELG